MASSKVLSARPVPVKKTRVVGVTRARVPATATATAAAAPRNLSILEIALSELAKDMDDARSGECMVRWNHYRKQFPVHNGILKFEDIDASYSYSFVYRGNYKRILRLSDGDDGPTVTSDPGMLYFIDIKPGMAYKIYIEEDPEAGVGAEGLRIHNLPFSAANKGKTTLPSADSDSSAAIKQSRQVALITEELRAMRVDALHGAEAKALREARDIEDVLFSNGAF